MLQRLLCRPSGRIRIRRLVLNFLELRIDTVRRFEHVPDLRERQKTQHRLGRVNNICKVSKGSKNNYRTGKRVASLWGGEVQGVSDTEAEKVARSH